MGLKLLAEKKRKIQHSLTLFQVLKSVLISSAVSVDKMNMVNSPFKMENNRRKPTGRQQYTLKNFHNLTHEKKLATA